VVERDTAITKLFFVKAFVPFVRRKPSPPVLVCTPPFSFRGRAPPNLQCYHGLFHRQEEERRRENKRAVRAGFKAVKASGKRFDRLEVGYIRIRRP
jgi:hypothetical protein